VVFEVSAHGLFGRAGSGPWLELLPKEEAESSGQTLFQGCLEGTKKAAVFTAACGNYQIGESSKDSAFFFGFFAVFFLTVFVLAIFAAFAAMSEGAFFFLGFLFIALFFALTCDQGAFFFLFLFIALLLALAFGYGAFFFLGFGAVFFLALIAISRKRKACECEGYNCGPQ
jgi:hypothetical protein